MSPRRYSSSGRYRSGRVEVEIDVRDVLDEIQDSELIEEIVERKLVEVVNKRAHGASLRPIPQDAGERLDNIQRDLMCRRTLQAQRDLEQLIDALVGREVMETLGAIKEGRIADAICCLERYRRPSPAATVDDLPRMREILGRGAPS